MESRIQLLMPGNVIVRRTPNRGATWRFVKLNDLKLHVSKIAWLLGFHEVSAFTHSFKRWSRKTPSQIRTAGAY